MDYLAFEQPIADLEAEIQRLEAEKEESADSVEKIRRLQRELRDMTAEIYRGLTPWQTVQVARHKDRPHTIDYLSLVFDEFVELHGDKLFGDDRAIRVGFADLDNTKVMVLGHQKGRTFQDRTENFFGCAHPEGYRKAMSKMRLAAKFGLPVICMINTPGAYPGIGAEERGQAQVIAENMYEMSRLPTPVICVVIGEGGSGGALGIGVGDQVAMLEHSYYSVISPEGCAGILWKGAEHAEKAATALKFTSQHLKEFGVVDDVIEEPLGGAHRDPHTMAVRLRRYFKQQLKTLCELEPEDLLNRRYERFRKLGVFHEKSATNGEAKSRVIFDRLTWKNSVDLAVARPDQLSSQSSKFQVDQSHDLLLNQLRNPGRIFQQLMGLSHELIEVRLGLELDHNGDPILMFDFGADRHADKARLAGHRLIPDLLPGEKLIQAIVRDAQSNNLLNHRWR